MIRWLNNPSGHLALYSKTEDLVLLAVYMDAWGELVQVNKAPIQDIVAEPSHTTEPDRSSEPSHTTELWCDSTKRKFSEKWLKKHPWDSVLAERPDPWLMLIDPSRAEQEMARKWHARMDEYSPRGSDCSAESDRPFQPTENWKNDRVKKRFFGQNQSTKRVADLWSEPLDELTEQEVIEDYNRMATKGIGEDFDNKPKGGNSCSKFCPFPCELQEEDCLGFCQRIGCHRERHFCSNCNPWDGLV